MPLVSQTRFPRLWLLMQNLVGGNKSKQMLALEHYQGQTSVLEIGCSVGNVSAAFRAYPNIKFTGIDIDQNAIRVAQKRFEDLPNFKFSLRSLQELSQNAEKFEYVLFAGMLHHVDDIGAQELLRDAMNCTTDNGKIIIYEPEALNASDNQFLHWFYSVFEQGEFLRSKVELISLIENSGIKIELCEDRMISPGICQRPYVARFNLIVGKPS